MSENGRTTRIKQILAALAVATPAVMGMVAEAPADGRAENRGQMTPMTQFSDGVIDSGAGAASNTIQISGEVIDGGVECPLFRTDDGQEFTLAGFRPHLLPVGTRMRLRGSIMQVSPCRQGISFRTIEQLE